MASLPKVTTKRLVALTAAGLLAVAGDVASAGLSAASRSAVEVGPVVNFTVAASPFRGPPATARAPTLRTRVVARGLDIPWDVAVLPGGDWLITERDRQRISIRTAPGQARVLADTPRGFWSSGETGLMSIVADPRVAKNDRFYTC